MFKLEVEITTDNVAFDGENREPSILHILRGICDKIENGQLDGRTVDLNGNRVGAWAVNNTQEAI